jgi:hypothetical protein
LMYLKPKTVAITKGYHGVHEVLHVYQEIANLVRTSSGTWLTSDGRQSIIALEDEYPEGTLCWLETRACASKLAAFLTYRPFSALNPVGETRDIQLCRLLCLCLTSFDGWQTPIRRTKSAAS